MALTLKPTSRNARFEYADGSMTVSWIISSTIEDEDLVDMLRRIVGFMDAQQASPPLPERIPGMALGMVQEAHPAPVGNGWAATTPPEVPADRKGVWELIEPGEDG